MIIISGDQIVQRIKLNAKGQVVERHPWCGFVGSVATLPEVAALIARAQRERS